MTRKVYIEQKENYVEVAILDKELEHFYRLQNELLTGSIVLGKVIKCIKELGIFMDIGRKKNALLKYREGLKVGDMLPVLIVREEEQEKGCAVTERLTLAGRYVVLNDTRDYRFSRKLSPERVEELKQIKLDDKKVGIVFRSSCKDVPNDVIFYQANQLYQRYIDILNRARNNTKVEILHQEKGMDVALRYAHSDEEIVYGFGKLQKEIENIFERKVEVEGVEIVFDKTEAMTVIDINSHKFNKRYKDADTAHYFANLIALKEVARQIRLRNIGGIIMVDIISLASDKLKYQLLDEFRQELLKDNVMVKANLIDFLSMIAIV
ncbi:MAG: hypothetical protein GX242_00700, partial [Clostridiales bacterium]|nr:hypothetical protein [Clostridiales bacterium]